MSDSDAEARKKLDIPEGYEAPPTEKIVEDARAILLHTLAMRGELKEAGIAIAPIWEDREGMSAVRATLVPEEVLARYFQGPGLAALRNADALEMIADTTAVCVEQPAAAAKALEMTHELWLHEEAPLKPLDMPYRGHFKVLTLVIADFNRKIGAGFTPIEWLTSMGLLASYHDPESDPPVEEIRASMRAKFEKMVQEEWSWMAAMMGEDPPDGAKGNPEAN